MKYGRTFNFSAGPAMMPEPVLEEIRDEMMNYRGSGMCVMEMSHRSKVFQQIADEAEADLRKLMHIPDNYKVLFIQGGGTVQFAMVAMNLMKNTATSLTIGLADLTLRSHEMGEMTFQFFVAFCFATVVYIIISLVINRSMTTLEKAVPIPGLIRR